MDMNFRIALYIIGLLLCAPAAAGESAWQEIAPDVSVRLISAGTVSDDGTSLLAVEIDMPEGTKTYWRVPGESGLPLDMDISGSTGVTGHSLHWPYPTREWKDDRLDYVYYGHTVLPFEVTVDDPGATVDLAATLGICSEICVPAQVQLSLPVLDTSADQASQLRIRQAMSEVPLPWPAGAEPVGTVTMVPDGSGIGIEIDSARLDPDSIIAASGESGPLFGEPQKSPETDLVMLPILGKSDNSELGGLHVEVTFMTDDGPYRVDRTVETGQIAEATGGD